MGSIMVIFGFFFVNSFAFAGRSEANFVPEHWQTRWFVLDGWLNLVYLCDIAFIAYLWRPTANNRRFAMSDEVCKGPFGMYEHTADKISSFPKRMMVHSSSNLLLTHSMMRSVQSRQLNASSRKEQPSPVEGLPRACHQHCHQQAVRETWRRNQERVWTATRSFKLVMKNSGQMGRCLMMRAEN